MRTIKVELVAPTQNDNENPLAAMFGGGSRIHISTESVVNDGDAEELRAAGREAAEAVTAFIEGYGEGQS